MTQCQYFGERGKDKYDRQNINCIRFADIMVELSSNNKALQSKRHWKEVYQTNVGGLQEYSMKINVVNTEDMRINNNEQMTNEG